MNLFAELDASPEAERFVELARRRGVRIERIVSLGQASPPGFWYDQPHGEWVVVLEGAARVRFADEPEARALARGDALDIAPHRRHRVEWTDPARPTVWLAVHYGEEGSPGEAPPG
ncbi:MAG: cupin domain-containing protein [Burkholderiales bacterium]|nr:cupin domain-containing protein [Burkholderiales bacterium]